MHIKALVLEKMKAFGQAFIEEICAFEQLFRAYLAALVVDKHQLIKIHI